MIYLVGESNPYSADPANALLPYPPGSAGHRLCHDIFGFQESDYLRLFERRNLCGPVWRTPTARHAAVQIASEARHIILLGSRVTEAFGLDFSGRLWHVGPQRLCSRPSLFGRRKGDARHVVAVLPHPSGRSRLWNSELAVPRARFAARAVAHCWGPACVYRATHTAIDPIVVASCMCPCNGCSTRFP